MSSNANFNASYSRRQAGQAPAPPKLSLLGDPPMSRNPSARAQQPSQSQSYGNYGYGYDAGAGSSGEYGKDAKYEEEYDMMMDEFNDYHNKNEPAAADSRAPMEYDIVDRGGRWAQNTPTRRQQDYNRGGESEAKHRNPSWKTNANPRDIDEPNRMGNLGPGHFNQQPNFGQNPNQQFPNQAQNLQGLGLNALVGQQQNQQLLNMQSGLLGMPMQMNPAQNAFLLQQQQLAAAAATANPMQLLLGNLPAFNSEALGKQILNAAAAAAGGGNPFGPGLGVGNRNLPQPLMGIRTEDSFNKRSFDRNASDRSRLRPRSPINAVRRDVGRSRDAGRVDRKRPGDRYSDADHKRVRGSEDDNKNRVLRTSIGSPARGRGGKDGNRGQNRKSDADKKKTDKKIEAKDTSKDKEKADQETEDVDVKKEAKEGEAEEEGTDAEKKSAGLKDKDKDKEKEEKRKSKYEEIPTPLLVCKVCQKTMNDASSFESHLSGRAHICLLDILKQRFLKRADLLMAESRLAEEEYGVEIERQKRAGKGGGGGKSSKNFCKMCDCNYTISWGAHKAGIHHRILKEFLHPTCRICDAQFVHRMDWVNHILGTSHLKKLAELKAAGKDLQDHESTHQGELFALSIEIGQDEHPSNCITVRNLDWKVPLKDDLRELLRDDMDIPEGEIIIPEKYDETVAVGEEAIMTTVGYCCKVCKIYMTRESEIESHLKDKPHFGMYTNFLKKVVRYREELQRREEAKAKGEPEVLDEKHLKKENIEGGDDAKNAMDENQKNDDGNEVEGIKENGEVKTEVKKEDTNANEADTQKENEIDEDELLKDESADENADGRAGEALKIVSVFTLEDEKEDEAAIAIVAGEDEQKMEAEHKLQPEESASKYSGVGTEESQELAAEIKIGELVAETEAEVVAGGGDGKSPAKSDPAPATVTLKPVLQKVGASAAATPASRNKAIRSGRGGRGTPATRGGTPARGAAAATATRGGASAGARGGARGGYGMRGARGVAGRGFPRADR